VVIKPIEVYLNKEWVDEIMDLIEESLEVDSALGLEERDAMRNIVINAIALYQAKITEHLQVSKDGPLN
jgi:hypothetical protein